MIINVTMSMEIEPKALEEVAKALENHIDWIMDLDSWSEIKSVFNVQVKEEVK